MKTPTAPIEVTSGGAMVSLLGEQACFCPQPGSQLLMTTDRDTFRQPRKTTTNFTASEHTTVTHTDAGGNLGRPVRQSPTYEAQRTQREKKEKQQTLRCHMKAELQACTHSSIDIANTPFPLASSE